MAREHIFALVITALLLWFLLGIYIGNALGNARQRKIALDEITKYVQTYLPDTWTAYNRGVNDGYEQGLHDGQDLFQ